MDKREENVQCKWTTENTMIYNTLMIEQHA
jgi:hypothetical protein